MSGNVGPYCTYSPTHFDEEGTVPITVSYRGNTTSFNVTVSEGIGTLEETNWNIIQTVAAQGMGLQYWAVGDTKTITLNGNVGDYLQLSNYSCKVFVLGFNHNNINGIYFQCFMQEINDANKLIALYPEDGYDTLYTSGKRFNMNHWGAKTYGGWKGCDLRYDILGSTDVAPDGYGAQAVSGRVGYDATSTCATNPVANTLMAALPSNLRAVIAPMTVYSDNVGGTDGAEKVTSSIDYLPLAAEFEVFGRKSYANVGEQTYQKQFDYYKNNSMTFYRHSSTNNTLKVKLRSYKVNSNANFAIIAANGGLSDGNAAAPQGLAPIFRVA